MRTPSCRRWPTSCRAETGPENIQIRLGGDEFMLFLKNCDKVGAMQVGPRLAAQVQGILVNTEKEIRLSVSIGMCSTEVVEDYNSLYRCVESTLKYVKEHGKGQAACYLDTSNELGVFLTQLYTEEHRVNAIRAETPRREDDLVAFALDLLGKSKNLDDAVFLLLSRVGRTYGFDRVSIIEANQAYLTYRFSYQWSRNRADLQLGQDFYVSQEDFDLCEKMYDEDGLADHNLREGISQIPSCLHAGIWNYGEYVGSMSFETYKENYRWSTEERKLLKELVKIVPSFIMKAKADAVSQAKTDFLSRMSHEIRTPMNAISGMTTIAKSVLDDREKALDCLEKIESANGYLLGLINDILDMSRIESGKLELNYEAMDLAQLLADLESLFRAQAQQKGPVAALYQRLRAGAGAARRPPAAEPGAGQHHRQRDQVHRRGQHHRAGGAGRGRAAGRAALFGGGHRRRHRARRAGPHLQRVRAGGALHRRPARRHRSGPLHLQPFGADDGRRPGGPQPGGRGL